MVYSVTGAGVTQGSTLGTLLFNIFLNIFLSIINSKLCDMIKISTLQEKILKNLN